jgi:hypothetical protein
MHDQVSTPANPNEPTTITSHVCKGLTNLMSFSSAKDFSARLGFSGDRMRMVVNSRVWMYG